MSVTDIEERFAEIIIPQEVVAGAFGQDVENGLRAQPKYLPCIYFYDEKGSQLFEQICDLPEYYLTRTEAEILQTYADAIVTLFPSQTDIIELGSGSSLKTRYLLEAFLRRHGQAFYNPIDISHTILRNSSLNLLQKYSGLEITAVAATYEEGLKRMEQLSTRAKLVLWLGSSIGNFEWTEAARFMRHLRETLTSNDSLLLGIDLKKERAVIERAYDDARGVTAAFNLNLLQRINRELDGHFNLIHFEHLALFNEQRNRIEMYLQSTKEQTVRIDKLNLKVNFAVDETIHTEFSHKFTPEDIRLLAYETGFTIKQQWFDKNGWFSLNLFGVEQ